MEHKIQSHNRTYIGICVVLILLLIGTLTYGYWIFKDLKKEYALLENELNSSRNTLTEKEADYSTTLDEMQQKIAISEENGAELLRLYNDEKDRNEEFEDQINRISGTVGKLDKLSKTDPELLIKYSRVFFLNENYKPTKVTEIDPEFLLEKNTTKFIHANVADSLENLLKDARDDEVNLLVASAYRSFDDQMGLKSTYTTNYGTGANLFSADQGYSEHQLGTTVDFTTAELAQLTGFETTEAYAWLQKNAYKYGFVISYPEENTYYVFEPWHWRFVGEKLAQDLHDDGKFFYDLDQREIDKYLISIFD